MTGIFGTLESSVTQCYQDVAPTQEYLFFIVASIFYRKVRRKARALLAAGRPDLARSFMKTNFRKIFKLTAEQCSKMDEELESVKKEADELYDKAVKEHNAEAGHQWPELKLRYPDFATVRRRLKEVELADGEHARFPAVSAALVLGKDEDRMDGHCFVAKRDIKPGWSLFLRWARPT